MYDLRGDIPCRLPDDRDVACDGVDGLLVGRKRFVGRTPAGRFDPEVDMFTTSPSSSTAVSPSHGGCQAGAFDNDGAPA